MEHNKDLIYFEDFIDPNTIVKGHIDQTTEKGKAYIYKKKLTIAIDLDITGVKKEPYLNKEKVASIAYEALKRHRGVKVAKLIPDEQEASGYHETCPACGKFVYDDYCSGCGQKLDWR